jgi:hypothetical protein
MTEHSSTDHSVISALLDDEPLDAAELARALADPAGRRLLLDLVALRQLVREDGPDVAAGLVRSSASRTAWLVAAAVILAISGTWFVASRVSAAPPRPDRVITLERGVDWQEK